MTDFPEFNRNEIREEWIRRLRSGQYEQCTKFLCQSDTYCCLGILSEIFVEKDMLQKEYREDKIAEYVYKDDEYENSYESVLPKEIVNLVGLYGPEGERETDDEENEIDCLTNLNDNGYSFEEIANLLESGKYWSSD